MTYRELLKQLADLNQAQLDQDVTVYVTGEDEFYSLDPDYPVAESCHLEEDRLDENHFYLRV